MTPISIGFDIGLASDAGGGVPSGYTRSTQSGVQFTYNGAPVFDNSPSLPLSVRTA